jgi:methylase of polypeptide subunit release factors
VAGLADAVADGAAASSEILPSDISSSAAEAALKTMQRSQLLKRCATQKQIRASRVA